MSEQSKPWDVMADYDERHATCVEFARELERLVQTVLKANGTSVHSVTSRVKSADSLRAKVTRYTGRYSQLSDVADVVGVRVITYLEDDVDRVGKILKREFLILEAEDKRRSMSPESFGYVSLHYVVRLRPKRRRLAEYKRFAECPAEIQVRSILQHAWAEIEHDLGYKTQIAVPQTYVRGFARIAGLLELADAEFVRLRDGLRRYEREVQARVKRGAESVTLDQASFQAFRGNSSLVNKLDRRLQTGLREIGKVVRLAARTPDPNISLRALSYLGMQSISDLKTALRENGEKATCFVIEHEKILSERDKPRWSSGHELYKGACIWWLCHYLALLRNPSMAGLMDYVETVVGWDQSEMSQPSMKRFLKSMLAAYKKVSAGRRPSR